MLDDEVPRLASRLMLLARLTDEGLLARDHAARCFTLV